MTLLLPSLVILLLFFCMVTNGQLITVRHYAYEHSHQCPLILGSHQSSQAEGGANITFMISSTEEASLHDNNMIVIGGNASAFVSPCGVDARSGALCYWFLSPAAEEIEIHEDGYASVSLYFNAEPCNTYGILFYPSLVGESECVPGYYADGDGVCLKCSEKDGSYCPGGGTRVWPKVGYWSYQENHVVPYKCLVREACPGVLGQRTESYRGSLREHDFHNETSVARRKTAICTEGYENVACSKCFAGWYFDHTQCRKCPSDFKMDLLYVALFYLLMGGFLTHVLYQYRMENISFIFSMLLQCQLFAWAGQVGCSNLQNDYGARIYNVLGLLNFDTTMLKAHCFHRQEGDDNDISTYLQSSVLNILFILFVFAIAIPLYSYLHVPNVAPIIKRKLFRNNHGGAEDYELSEGGDYQSMLDDAGNDDLVQEGTVIRMSVVQNHQLRVATSPSSASQSAIMSQIGSKIVRDPIRLREESKAFDVRVRKQARLNRAKKQGSLESKSANESAIYSFNMSKKQQQ